MTIEIDCTPEEARRAMGLPDLSPLHSHYLTKLRDAMEGGSINPEIIGNLMKSWGPASDAGFEFWRTMFAGAAKPRGE